VGKNWNAYRSREGKRDNKGSVERDRAREGERERAGCRAAVAATAHSMSFWLQELLERAHDLIVQSCFPPLRHGTLAPCFGNVCCVWPRSASGKAQAEGWCPVCPGRSSSYVQGLGCFGEASGRIGHDSVEAAAGAIPTCLPGARQEAAASRAGEEAASRHAAKGQEEGPDVSQADFKTLFSLGGPASQTLRNSRPPASLINRFV
jgi:hypothetical protein